MRVTQDWESVKEIVAHSLSPLTTYMYLNNHILLPPSLKYRLNMYLTKSNENKIV